MNDTSNCNIVEIGYTFTDNNNKERIFCRNVYLYNNQINEFFKNRSNIDNYCSAFSYDDKDLSKANLFGNLYLDFDDVNNISHAREDAIHTLSFLKIVYKIDNSQIMIFFSGNKGFHIIVPKEVLGITPDKNLNGIFKYIANQINNYSVHKTVDTQIYDNKRLFRMPNTINGKTGLYKIQLTAKELLNLSENQILEMAKQPRQYINIDRSFNTFANHQYKELVNKYYKELEESKINDKNFKYKRTLNSTMYKKYIR